MPPKPLPWLWRVPFPLLKSCQMALFPPLALQSGQLVLRCWGVIFILYFFIFFIFKKEEEPSCI